MYLEYTSSRVTICTLLNKAKDLAANNFLASPYGVTPFGLDSAVGSLAFFLVLLGLFWDGLAAGFVFCFFLDFSSGRVS